MSEARVIARPGKTMLAITDQDGKGLKSVSAPDFFVKNEPQCSAFGNGPVFSSPQPENNAEFFTTGKEYFEAVALAIAGAKKSVFITGWQINFDVILTGKTRLFDCLVKAIDGGASVYVMPWLSPKVGVDTGDFETMLAVFQLNAGRSGPPQAFALPAIAQSDMGTLDTGFSHHQKLVVIDNKIAFVGGIDLAYGRRDDAKFSLIANSDNRDGCEMYNPCVPPLKELWSEEQAKYLTRAELLAACFNPATVASQASQRVAAKVRDAVGVDNIKEWWAEESAFLAWINHKVYGPDSEKNIVDDAGKAVRQAAANAAAWHFDKLPDSLKRALGHIIVSGAGDIKRLTGVLFAWLNNRGLESLSYDLHGQSESTLKTIVLRCYQALNYASDSMPFRYAFLMNGRTMLPKDAKTINPATQPRMPWQDVQVKVEGPSVYDLAQNFIRRWNSVQHLMRSPSDQFKLTGHEPQELKTLLSALQVRAKIKPHFIPKALIPERAKPTSGKCTMQVLRSAPRKLRQDEYRAMSREQQEQAAQREPEFTQRGMPAPVQDNCLKAMIRAIGSSVHFLYIEGQFFQSEHGDAGGYDTTARSYISGPTGWLADFASIPGYTKYEALLNLRQAALSPDPNKHIKWDKIPSVLKDDEFPDFIAGLKRVLANQAQINGSRALKTPQEKLINPVGQALSERIEYAIFNEQPFHVYLVLPVHPEGTLNTLTIMTQVHHTMQSLVFGQKSLVNRIRRSIKVKELLKQNKSLSLQGARDQANALTLKQLADQIPNAWQEYLTLLNLRTWDMIGGKPVTEQIYVHSKLLIADDRAAVLGSANINDRSMLGDRDSELAIVIHDGEEVKIAMNGEGKQHPVSKAVHELRAALWKKHLGITGGIRPATELAACIDKPADPATWMKIQARANENAKAYDEAFPFIPRNESTLQKTEASVWPMWKYPDPPPGQEVIKVGGKQQGLMPFQEEFWKQKKAATIPNNLIRGFIVALPVKWTARENNDSKFNLTLLAEMKDANSQTTLAVASDTQPSGKA